MLPLCFGEATKVCAFLLDADKTYRVTAKLGSATDTGDATGTETANATVPLLSADEWNEVLQRFVGESLQVPPMYSALKKDGKRLYELARKGKTVKREPRPIRIEQIELLELAGKRLVFRVRCSKGTYIRSLVEDIAKVAETVAHTSRLHRETVADFRAEDMRDLRTLEALGVDGPVNLRKLLMPADAALAALPEVGLEAGEAAKFCGGQQVMTATDGSGLARVYDEQREFLGVGEVFVNGKMAPRRVFRTTVRPFVDI
jgi:tRNA pseudouridine55 synthase